VLDCARFYELIESRGIRFFTGVPDSLLKNICAYITDHTPSTRHVITANEGGAVGLAAGHYLGSGQPAMVYMQNSGQGNAINPLASLADPDVYGIPMLLMIGWRGEPGVKDEPQHVKQGKITLDLLDVLGIPYVVLESEEQLAEKSLTKLLDRMFEESRPAALVISDGVFAPYKMKKSNDCDSALTREEAIRIIVDQLDPQDVVVSTTGKTSRELYEYRDVKDQGHQRDFLTVGSMGHSSHIALGIALNQPQRQVFCLDGDGAALMHMGAMAVNASLRPRNLKHIILNNGCHDSVGGQPTVGFAVSFTDIALACGYAAAWRVDTPDTLAEMVAKLRQSEGPALLEVRVRSGARDDLGRPKTTPIENMKSFMELLSL